MRSAFQPPPLLLLMFSRGRASTRFAVAIAVSQFDVLALNAISRQRVQNLELSPVLDLTAEPVHLQLNPLIVFLVLFVAGLAVIL
ncbi:MAG: hypothetical protein V2G42_09230 [bacterium JZ-2024 1]